MVLFIYIQVLISRDYCMVKVLANFSYFIVNNTNFSLRSKFTIYNVSDAIFACSLHWSLGRLCP